MDNKNNLPLVSISCITYNHAPYIRQCLDGFLMQKTNFKFEVLIHDDASTDGTEEIIREYEAKYPDIIKALYEEENQYVLGRRGSKTFNYPRAKGKYIALCEGDDYWTDPYKLQKQVDFLEENDDYVLSNTDVCFLYEESQYYLNNYNKKKKIENFTGDVSLEKILNGNYVIRTVSVLCRTKNVLDYINSDFQRKMSMYLLMGDTPLWAFLSLYGKFHYIKESTAVYRKNKGSVSNQLSVSSSVKFTLSSYIMRCFFVKEYPELFSLSFQRKMKIKYNKAVVNAYLFDVCSLDEIPFDLLDKSKRHIKLYSQTPFLKQWSKIFFVLYKKIFRLLQDFSYHFKKIIQ